jgi:hypothetical protein
MPHTAQFRPLPLPRGWPRCVRSAVFQVISLARISLALTQGWASESLNPELRQRAEEDRLQQEVQLPREEIRIEEVSALLGRGDRVTLVWWNPESATMRWITWSVNEDRGVQPIFLHN